MRPNGQFCKRWVYNLTAPLDLAPDLELQHIARFVIPGAGSEL